MPVSRARTHGTQCFGQGTVDTSPSIAQLANSAWLYPTSYVPTRYLPMLLDIDILHMLLGISMYLHYQIPYLSYTSRTFLVPSHTCNTVSLYMLI